MLNSLTQASYQQGLADLAFGDNFVVNPNECLMKRIQRMTLDYHFKAEQESGSSLFGFFGFNGAAGVWRIFAINEAGGWKDRTTVEDMDLAVRASLKGGQFVYVGDVKEVSIWRKFYLLYSFFFIRKVVAHLVTFFLYCVVIPVSVLVPEVSVPVWGVAYIPTAITLLNAIRNTRIYEQMSYILTACFNANDYEAHYPCCQKVWRIEKLTMLG